MVAFPAVIMYSTMFESVAVLGYRWARDGLLRTSTRSVVFLLFLLFLPTALLLLLLLLLW
jgi:hypothetical protein